LDPEIGSLFLNKIKECDSKVTLKYENEEPTKIKKSPIKKRVCDSFFSQITHTQERRTKIKK